MNLPVYNHDNVQNTLFKCILRFYFFLSFNEDNLLKSNIFLYIKNPVIFIPVSAYICIIGKSFAVYLLSIKTALMHSQEIILMNYFLILLFLNLIPIKYLT